MSPRKSEANVRIAIEERLRKAGRDPSDEPRAATQVRGPRLSVGAGLAHCGRARPLETHASVENTAAATREFGQPKSAGESAEEIGGTNIPSCVRLSLDRFAARVERSMMGPAIRDGSNGLGAAG